MRTAFTHWLPLWQRLKGIGDAEFWHERLVAAYGESQRAYHTLQHLDECLRAFDEAKTGGLIQQPDFIELALWFHDMVYDPRAAENEERSAEMADECLETMVAAEVRRLILVTKTHQAVHEDEQWLVDIDLAILGAEQGRFDEYERQIREEYAWVPEAVYREKRTEILNGFLSRERLYLTTWARERFETRARENLRTLIGRMVAS